MPAPIPDRQPARPALAATGAKAPTPADRDQPAAPALEGTRPTGVDTAGNAAGLRVDFFEPCDEEPDRRALLRRLAANARLGQYFYSLTVRDGSVHALVERQITPAC